MIDHKLIAMTLRLETWCAAAIAAVFVLAGASAPAQDTLTIPRQGDAPQLSPPIQGSQSQRPFEPRPNDENTRIIPVIPPSAQVLVLPRVSTDFIGKWGGHLQLAYKTGVGRMPQSTIVSLIFGKRAGQVVLATTVFGSASAQILETKADSEGPRAVKIVLKGVDLSTQPAMQHVEKLHLDLESNNLVHCRKTVTLYVPGPGQIMEAEYDGDLRALTPREDRALSEEVLRQAQEHGYIPRARIEEGNPPPPD